MATPEKDNCSSSLSSHYALHVALQTMKERCQNLQKRLSVLEEENFGLKMTQSDSSLSTASSERRVSNQTELEMLREKVSDLSRQKIQLTAHISMVAAENRQLWSRLSQLAKDNQSLGGAASRLKESPTVGGSQNLIRSKTFTKNAPNPKLRERLPREGGEASSSYDEMNMELEDVSLLNMCGFIDAGNGTDMGFLQNDGDELMMFDLENNPDAKRCTEGLMEIQKELLKHQTMLKLAVEKFKTMQETCQACKTQKTDSKPQMVDKIVEVGNDLPQHHTEDLPLPEIPKIASSVPRDGTVAAAESEATTLKYINFQQEKIRADAQDKMCPMCGKMFVKNMPFDEFQEHVEAHFIDHEVDLSLDPSYKYIYETVGNF